MFWFGTIAQILVFGGIAFFQPFLSLHLMKYEHFSSFWIGMYFAMPAIAYIVNTILVATYCKLLSRKVVIFIGLVFFSISFFFVGTSPMLEIENSSRLILIGLLLLGFSAAMITVPLLPEVLSEIENRFPHLKSEELNNVISGYFNSCIGIGEALGPITAGFIVST